MSNQKTIKFSCLLEKIQQILLPSNAHGIDGLMRSIEPIAKNEYRVHRKALSDIFDCGEVFGVYKGAVEADVEFGDLYDNVFAVLEELFPKIQTAPDIYANMMLDVGERERLRNLLIERLDNLTNPLKSKQPLPQPFYDSFLSEEGGRIRFLSIMDMVTAELGTDSPNYTTRMNNLIRKEEFDEKALSLNEIFQVGDLPQFMEGKIKPFSEYGSFNDVWGDCLAHLFDPKAEINYQSLLLNREERTVFRDDFFKRIAGAYVSGFTKPIPDEKPKPNVRRKAVFFTVQQYNLAYFHSNYGVMPVSQPISNFAELGLAPIMVCELRSPYGVGPETLFRSHRQYFFATQTVDFIKWIDVSINRENLGFFDEVVLAIDPKLEPAITQNFIDEIGRLDKIILGVGNGSNKSHASFYRQCQTPMSLNLYQTEKIKPEFHPKEPFGLSLEYLNKDDWCSMPTLEECKTPQVEIKHQSLVVNSKKAMHVDPGLGYLWQPARDHGQDFIEYGCILVNEEHPLHSRNKTFCTADRSRLDSVSVKAILSLIPKPDKFGSKLLESNSNLPPTIISEIKQIKSGKIKALYSDLLDSISLYYCHGVCTSSVFHLGKASFPTIEAVQNIVTERCTFDRMFLLFEHEGGTQTPHTIIYQKHENLYAFVGKKDIPTIDKIDSLIRQAEWLNKEFISIFDEDLIRKIEVEKGGLMSEDLRSLIICNR